MGEAVKRPMEGLYLRDGLKRLAEICTIADTMRMDLDPLTADDIAMGAEPLSPAQMQEDLQKIAMIATMLALEEFQAKPEEWYAANDSIA